MIESKAACGGGGVPLGSARLFGGDVESCRAALENHQTSYITKM